MILTELAVDADVFTHRTGWVSKPEGLCLEDLCVPAPGVARGDGTLDVTILAERLGMPLVHDEAHDLWALGPATATGHSLSSAVAPDLELPDRAGDAFQFASLRGQKVALVAWASW